MAQIGADHADVVAIEEDLVKLGAAAALNRHLTAKRGVGCGVHHWEIYIPADKAGVNKPRTLPDEAFFSVLTKCYNPFPSRNPPTLWCPALGGVQLQQVMGKLGEQ